jgi:hypothetical protein
MSGEKKQEKRVVNKMCRKKRRRKKKCHSRTKQTRSKNTKNPKKLLAGYRKQNIDQISLPFISPSKKAIISSYMPIPV